MAVCPSESRLTGAAEVAGRLADAAAVRSADIGRDVPHLFLGAVGRYGNGAAVNHSALVCLAVILQLGAGFALVVVGAAAVEVSGQAVALSLVVTGVGTARVALHLTR